MLGDYVDRGPDSLGTLRRLIGLERSLGIPVHALCGNHDQYLIEFLLADRPEPEALEAWCGNGGRPRWPSWASAAPSLLNRDPAELAARARAAAGPEVLSLLRRLQLYAAGRRLCLRPCRDQPALPLAENSRRELLWLREPFLAGKGWRHAFTAIHGHTIRGPEVLPHRIAVDSGTYRTGVLTAVQIEDDRLRFVCVTSEPKLKAFKRLPGLEQRRRFSAPEPLAADAGVPAGGRGLTPRSEHGQRLLALRRRELPVDGGEVLRRSARSSAAALASTCSIRAAFGIASTPGCARTQASAIWNGVQPWAGRGAPARRRSAAGPARSGCRP